MYPFHPVSPRHVSIFLFVCVMLLGGRSAVFAATGDNSEYEAMIAKLPAPEQMLPDDLSKWELKHGDDYGDFEIVSVQDMPFKQALRIRNRKFSRDSYNVQLDLTAIKGAEQGQIMLLTFYGRVIDTTSESGEGTAKVYFRRNRPPWGGATFRESGLEPQWKKFYAPFRMELGRGITTAPAEELALVINACYNKSQTIELADFKVMRFPDDTDYTKLPASVETYAGREPNAAWRAEALARIDKIRKGDLTIKVVDASDQPVGDANVHVKMTRHGFEFGAAFNSTWWNLQLDKPAARKYGREFVKYFNLAAHIGDLKWPQWVDNRQLAIDSVDWLAANGLPIHGHNLVWPRWDKTPFAKDRAKQRYFEKNPAELQKAILEHIRDEVSTLGDKVQQWDVWNEPFSHYQLADLVGMDGVAQWFQTAHEANPRAMLMLNEGGKLSRPNIDSSGQQNFIRIIREMQARHAPLGGLGFESHFRWGVPDPKDVLKVLDYYDSEFHLPIYITEFDHRIDDRQLQADWERDFLIICFSHPAVHGFTRWGWWNGISNGGFLDDNWKLLPNGEQFTKLVYHDWWTDEKGKTDAQGLLKMRAFYGDYDVEVEYNGETYPASFTLTKDGPAAFTVTLSDQAKQAELQRRKTERKSRKQEVEAIEARTLEHRNAREDAAAKAKAKAEANVAASGKLRISTGGKELDAVLKPLDATSGSQFTNGSWLPPDQASHVLLFQLDAPADQWQQVQFRFVSDKDAAIPLTLASELTKSDELPVWVMYDDMTITGAANAPAGDFENGGKKGPDGWTIKKRRHPARVIDDKQIAHGGERCVVASFGGAIQTTIDVKAGQPVTVQVWARLYKPGKGDGE